MTGTQTVEPTGVLTVAILIKASPVVDVGGGVTVPPSTATEPLAVSYTHLTLPTKA